jgi:tricorn protease
MAVPLRADVEHPLVPKSDAQEWEAKSPDGDDGEASDASSQREGNAAEKSSKKSKENPKKSGKKKGKKRGKAAKKKAEEAETKSKKPDSKSKESDKDKAESDDSSESSPEADAVEIDFAGIEARTFRIPVGAGGFANLSVSGDGKLVYARVSARGDESTPAIMLVAMEDGKAEEQTIVDGAASYQLTADGKQMLVQSRGGVYVVKPQPGQKLSSPISTDGMTVEIDRREEWQQIFRDAWRIERDFFYDPNMHGVDWVAVRKRYERLLDDCVSRQDLSYVIREMISELNVGHAYYREAPLDRGPSRPVGLLGCQFEIHDDSIVISKIWQGGIWDTDARNGLVSAGVREGDVLVSVEGVAVDASQSPYKHFMNKLGPKRQTL